MMDSRFTLVKSPTVATSGLSMAKPSAVSASSDTPTRVPPASSQALAKLPMQATTRWGFATVTSLPKSSVKVTAPSALAVAVCSAASWLAPSVFAGS